MKIEDIDKAFTYFYTIDIYDLSKEGEESFEMAKKRYEVDIDAVEKNIINKLREKLGSATNAGEMFKIFNKFSSLLSRQQVRSSIGEYTD
jgi:dynein heavy chain 1, cytosolic